MVLLPQRSHMIGDAIEIFLQKQHKQKYVCVLNIFIQLLIILFKILKWTYNIGQGQAVPCTSILPKYRYIGIFVCIYIMYAFTYMQITIMHSSPFYSLQSVNTKPLIEYFVQYITPLYSLQSLNTKPLIEYLVQCITPLDRGAGRIIS